MHLPFCVKNAYIIINIILIFSTFAKNYINF